MHRKYSLSMKALLLLTALMVSALPAKADGTQFTNRVRMIGAMTYATCRVRKGDRTEEQARELSKKYVNKYPEVKAAYSWAITSYKALEAVQALAPHMNSECDEINLSEEELNQLIKPYLD